MPEQQAEAEPQVQGEDNSQCPAALGVFNPMFTCMFLFIYLFPELGFTLRNYTLSHSTSPFLS
jgi:hypothetical protein